jgi:hypothetical protein
MAVLVLDDDRARLAVDGDVEDRRAGQQNSPELARIDGEGVALAILAAVDHAGHQAAAAQAPRGREPRSVRSSTFSSGRCVAAIGSGGG